MEFSCSIETLKEVVLEHPEEARQLHREFVHAGSGPAVRFLLG